MKYEYLIFDLDGTISDPIVGIVRSVNYSLFEHGFEAKSDSEISTHIGPPLDELFASLTGSNNQVLLESLIKKYRERYKDVGYSENTLYPEMPEVLGKLKQKYKLVVCTSKKEDFAKKILSMFGLLNMFIFINGADIGIQKWQHPHQSAPGPYRSDLWRGIHLF